MANAIDYDAFKTQLIQENINYQMRIRQLNDEIVQVQFKMTHLKEHYKKEKVL